MLHFLQALIKSDAVVTLAIWVFFLFSLVWTGAHGVYTNVQGKVYGGLVPFLFFLIVTVVAFIAWAVLVSG